MLHDRVGDREPSDRIGNCVSDEHRIRFHARAANETSGDGGVIAETDSVLVRWAATMPGDRHPHPRTVLNDLPGCDSHLREGTGPRAFDHHVGSLEQLRQLGLTRWRSEVESD